MSNAFGNYNEIFFAQEALLVLHKALGMAGRVFRGYDPSPQAYGDTIRLRRPTAFTAANAPAAATDLNPDPNILEINLTAQVAKVEVAPGKTVEAWTYNGSLPGPLIRLKVGDRASRPFAITAHPYARLKRDALACEFEEGAREDRGGRLERVFDGVVSLD